MSEQFDPEKQIHRIGLEKTGDRAYKCKYPALLVEWLKGRGLVEVETYDYHKPTELMLEGDIWPQPPESDIPPEKWHEGMRARGYVSIYKTGSVRVGGHSEKLEQMLQELLRETLMDSKDVEIDEARAAKDQVDAWATVVKKAQKLPYLLADRERQRAKDARSQRLGQALEQARVVLSQAAIDTQAWHTRLITLCQELDQSTPETASDLRAELRRHMDSLLEIQAPILKARSELKVLAGAGFERLWAEAGGYNAQLSPDPDHRLVRYAYRQALRRRLKGRTVYWPRPIPEGR